MVQIKKYYFYHIISLCIYQIPEINIFKTQIQFKCYNSNGATNTLVHVKTYQVVHFLCAYLEKQTRSFEWINFMLYKDLILNKLPSVISF